MCLAIPGRVVRLRTPADDARFAEVDFDGIVKTVSLIYTPEAELGSYVVVHAGFATSVIPEPEALGAIACARALASAAASAAPVGPPAGAVAP
jgi:hydrogenase expression/formation protein HypC